MMRNVLHRGVLSTNGEISHIELRKDKGFNNVPLYHLYDVYTVNCKKESIVRGFGGYDNLDEAISAYGRVLGIEISEETREYIKEKDQQIKL